MQIGAATAELTQALGRSPTPARARRAASAARSRRSSRASSRATPTRRCRWTPATTARTAPRTMLDAIGRRRREPRARRDPRVDQAAARTGSTPREKKILLLRFFKNMTQSQIADEIGVSQMHVSRLLTRTLDAAARRSLEESEHRGSRSVAGVVGEARRCSAGCSSPASTTTRHDREPDRDARVSRRPGSSTPSPSWISWASTIGLRAQELAAGAADQAQQQQAGAVRDEEAAVVTPMATRPRGEAGQPRGRPARAAATPSTPTSEAATTRGRRVGRLGRSRRQRRRPREPVPRLTAGRCDACDERDRAQGLFNGPRVATLDDALVNVVHIRAVPTARPQGCDDS